MSSALESARAKITRVMKYHELFEGCIAEYRGDNPYEFIINSRGTRELRILKAPPIELSILAGEVVYHLRSALDHLFFELVQRNLIGPLPKNILYTCQFPLFTQMPDGFTGSLPMPRDYLKIPYWVPDPAYIFIEGLQPYHRRDEGHRLLKFLVKLSNIDKHRRLNTTVTTIERRQTFVHSKGWTGTFIHPFLHDGADIRPMHPPPEFADEGEVEMKEEFIPQIAFDEPEIGPPQTALLHEVIYDLPNCVFNILGGFNKFLH